MMNTIRFGFLLTLAALHGCSQLGITEQKISLIDTFEKKKDTIEIASLPSQLRTIYIHTRKDGSRYTCAEPLPDVAAANSLSATASAVNQLSSGINTTLNESINRAYNASNSNQASASLQNADGTTTSSNNSANTNTGNTGNSTGSTYGATANAQQSINLALNAATQIVALEGRTQFVLLARELSFRTCEAAANGEYDKTDSKVYAQHQNIISALIKMIDTQKAEAEAKKINAMAEVAKNWDATILANAATADAKAGALNAYKKKRDKCIADAKADKSKVKQCETTFDQEVTILYGK